MVIGRDGQIIQTSLPQENPQAEKLAGGNIYENGMTKDQMNNAEMTPFFVLFDGRWYVCMRRETYGGRNALVMLPLAEISAAVMVLPCVSILFLGIIVFSIRIMLVHLNNSSEKVYLLQQEQQKRRKKDLDLARQIQAAELRYDHPDTEHSRVDSFMKPMEEVGGDFYDFYTLPDGRLICTIADVSGDGIPAAIFMMKAKTTLREQIFSCSTLEEAVTCTNERLCMNNEAKMFVTVWIGILNPDTGVCEYICAGHNLPILKRRRETKWLQGTNSPGLGVSPKAKFKMKSIQFCRGDILFLYTDGIIDAKNAAGEMFTGRRLFDLFTFEEHASYIEPLRKI